MEHDKWVSLHWVNPLSRRRYTACLCQDLWGEWVVIQLWGGLGSKRTGRKRVYCSSAEEGANIIQKISRKRQTRGYKL